MATSSTPAWFNANYYLHSKLAQLQDTFQMQYTINGPTPWVTVQQVQQAIESAGLTVYQHFTQFSLLEGTSPDSLFDTKQYLEAKAVQMGYAETEWSYVGTLLSNAGYTNAYQHYADWGWTEGLNTSNGFDSDLYIAEMAVAKGMTVPAVIAALKAAHLNPLSHYYQYGQSEGLVPVAVPLIDQVEGVDYAVTAAPVAIAEGAAVEFTLSTHFVEPGTEVGFTVLGSGSAAGQTYAGVFVVARDGMAKAVVNVPSNQIFGDTGSLLLQLNNGLDSVTVAVSDATANPVTPIDAQFDRATAAYADALNTAEISNTIADENIAASADLIRTGTTVLQAQLAVEDADTAVVAATSEYEAALEALDQAMAAVALATEGLNVASSNVSSATLAGQAAKDLAASNATTAQANLLIAQGAVSSAAADLAAARVLADQADLNLASVSTFTTEGAASDGARAAAAASAAEVDAALVLFTQYSSDASNLLLNGASVADAQNAVVAARSALVAATKAAADAQDEHAQALAAVQHAGAERDAAGTTGNTDNLIAAVQDVTDSRAALSNAENDEETTLVAFERAQAQVAVAETNLAAVAATLAAEAASEAALAQSNAAEALSEQAVVDAADQLILADADLANGTSQADAQDALDEANAAVVQAQEAVTAAVEERTQAQNALDAATTQLAAAGSAANPDYLAAAQIDFDAATAQLAAADLDLIVANGVLADAQATVAIAETNLAAVAATLAAEAASEAALAESLLAADVFDVESQAALDDLLLVDPNASTVDEAQASLDAANQALVEADEAVVAAAEEHEQAHNALVAATTQLNAAGSAQNANYLVAAQTDFDNATAQLAAANLDVIAAQDLQTTAQNTVVAAQNQYNAVVSQQNFENGVFSLTTGFDDLTGRANYANTFVANLDAGSMTLNDEDIIQGGTTSNDTLEVQLTNYVAGVDVVVSPWSVTSVENLIVTSNTLMDSAVPPNGSVTLDLINATSQPTDMQDITVVGGAGTLVIDNVTAADIELSNTTGTTTVLGYQQGTGAAVTVLLDPVDTTLSFGRNTADQTVTLVSTGPAANTLDLNNLTGAVGRVDVLIQDQADYALASAQELILTTNSLINDVRATGADGTGFTGRLDATLGTVLGVSSILVGGTGNDRLIGALSDDLIDGNAGSDYIDGSGGADTLFGDAGTDTLLGGVGDDSIYGGDDADTIDGGGDNDLILGGLGNDLIDGNTGADTIYGEDGLDEIDGGAGNDTIYGGNDGDTIDGGNDNDTIYGDAGADNLTGGAGNDVMYGGTEGDTINANGGTDEAHGQDGDDFIYGGDDVDTLYGDAGEDTIEGGSGADTVYGGADNDTISGGAGNDTLSGGAGNDLITIDGAGTPGDDTVFGDAGNDVIIVTGSGGTNNIYGGVGFDRIQLLTNTDTIYQGLTDSVAGTYTGGATVQQGATMQFLSGVDTIQNFTTGTDKIGVRYQATTDNLIDQNATALAANTTFLQRGNWDAPSNTFTVDVLGTSTLVVQSAGTGNDNLGTNVNAVVVVGAVVTAGDLVANTTYMAAGNLVVNTQTGVVTIEGSADTTAALIEAAGYTTVSTVGTATMTVNGATNATYFEFNNTNGDVRFAHDTAVNDLYWGTTSKPATTVNFNNAPVSNLYITDASHATLTDVVGGTGLETFALQSSNVPDSVSVNLSTGEVASSLTFDTASVTNFEQIDAYQSGGANMYIGTLNATLVAGTTSVLTGSGNTTLNAAAGNVTVVSSVLAANTLTLATGNAANTVTLTQSTDATVGAGALASNLVGTFTNTGALSVTAGSANTTLNLSANTGLVTVNGAAADSADTLTITAGKSATLTTVNNLDYGTLTVDSSYVGDLTVANVGDSNHTLSNNVAALTVAVTSLAGAAADKLITTNGVGGFTLGSLVADLDNSASGTVDVTLSAPAAINTWTVDSSTAITVNNGTADASDTLTIAGAGQFTVNALAANLQIDVTATNSSNLVNTADASITLNNETLATDVAVNALATTAARTLTTEGSSTGGFTITNLQAGLTNTVQGTTATLLGTGGADTWTIASTKDITVNNGNATNADTITLTGVTSTETTTGVTTVAGLMADLQIQDSVASGNRAVITTGNLAGAGITTITAVTTAGHQGGTFSVNANAAATAGATLQLIDGNTTGTDAVTNLGSGVALDADAVGRDLTVGLKSDVTTTISIGSGNNAITSADTGVVTGTVTVDATASADNKTLTLAGNINGSTYNIGLVAGTELASDLVQGGNGAVVVALDSVANMTITNIGSGTTTVRNGSFAQGADLTIGTGAFVVGVAGANAFVGDLVASGSGTLSIVTGDVAALGARTQTIDSDYTTTTAIDAAGYIAATGTTLELIGSSVKSVTGVATNLTVDVNEAGAGAISIAAGNMADNVALTLTDTAVTGPAVTITALTDGDVAAGTYAGNLTITAGGGAASNQSIVLGSGTNVVNFAGSTLRSGDVINGTAGTADTLNVTGNTAIAATDLQGTVNIETVTFANTTTNVAVTTVDGNFTTAGTYTYNAASLSTGELSFNGNADGAAVQALYVVSGGAGADVITGGAGADTITGNGGNDVITGNGGADTLNGNAGDDTFKFADQTLLAAAAVVNGGADVNTLEFTNQITTAVDLGAAAYANMTNVTRLTLDNGSTAAVKLAAAMTDATVAAGDASVTLSAAGQDVTSLLALSGNLTVNSAYEYINTSGVGNTTSIVGRALGTNTVNITNRVDAGLNLNYPFVIQNISNLILAGGTLATVIVDSGMTSITLGNGVAGTLSEGAYVDLTANGQSVNAISLSDAQVLSLDDNVGTYTGSVTLSLGDLLATAYAGDLLVNATTGSNVITTGAGNDTINAGSGVDTVNAGNGNNTVNGEAGNDTITTGTGNDTVTGGDGEDIINVGSGTNTVTGGADADSITLGGGTDTVIFTTGMTADTLYGFATTIDELEYDASEMNSVTGALSGQATSLSDGFGVALATPVAGSFLAVAGGGRTVLTAANVLNITATGLTNTASVEAFLEGANGIKTAVVGADPDGIQQWDSIAIQWIEDLATDVYHTGLVVFNTAVAANTDVTDVTVVEVASIGTAASVAGDWTFIA